MLKLFSIFIIFSSFVWSTCIDCDQNEKSLEECASFCRIYFTGSKNFFNQTSSLCESVPLCTDLQEYNNETNECMKIQNYVDIDNITGSIEEEPDEDKDYEVVNVRNNFYFLNNFTSQK